MTVFRYRYIIKPNRCGNFGNTSWLQFQWLQFCGCQDSTIIVIVITIIMQSESTFTLELHWNLAIKTTQKTGFKWS